jgi:hypothetical protein
MLAGKAIAHVGSSFMACVTHSELKRLILAEYPSARIILPDEIGSAGPYPRPSVVWREKDAFQRKLGEQRVPDFLFLEGAGMQTRTGNSPMFTGVQPLENRAFFPPLRGW